VDLIRAKISGSKGHAETDAKLAALDGVDLLPFLTGKNNAAPHARLYWRMDGG
jgi:hypothetical protein